MYRYRFAVGLLVALFGLAAALPAHAAGPTTATGTFDATTDTFKPVNDSHPAGTVVFSQTGPTGAITGVVALTGLLPFRQYVVVPYKDAVCAPTPGFTAFPSSRFTSDAVGSANTPVTVNVNAINPTATLDLTTVQSISIREVAVPAPTLPPVPILGVPAQLPNVPTPITEACDSSPAIASS